MIGDRWRDVGAGRAAGCRTIFIDYNYAERRPDSPDFLAQDLAEAVDIVLAARRTKPDPRVIHRGNTLLDRLRIKIFADGADIAGMKALAANPLVKGFTTNPTLMRKAGITDYVAFAHEVLAAIPDRPVSFEVFADEFPEMEAQALEIASWGKNVYVKIPVTNTQARLGDAAGATAVQAGRAAQRHRGLHPRAGRGDHAALDAGTPAVISVFAGRIADTGIDPVPLMAEAKQICPRQAEGRAPVGEPARASQYLPCRQRRLRHHHRDARRAGQARSGGQGPRRLLARDRKDVLQGRFRGRLQHPGGDAQGRARTG